MVDEYKGHQGGCSSERKAVETGWSRGDPKREPLEYISNQRHWLPAICHPEKIRVFPLHARFGRVAADASTGRDIRITAAEAVAVAVMPKLTSVYMCMYRDDPKFLRSMKCRASYKGNWGTWSGAVSGAYGRCAGPDVLTACKPRRRVLRAPHAKPANPNNNSEMFTYKMQLRCMTLASDGGIHPSKSSGAPLRGSVVSLTRFAGNLPSFAYASTSLPIS